MRRRKSFLLTVIPSEEPQNAFCGQVKSIDTGKAFFFSNIDELKQLLMGEISSGLTKPLVQVFPAGTLPDPSKN